MTHLGLERAALLLPDYDESVFVPWASVGHDATTLHRLRVMASDIDAVTREGSVGVLWTNGSIKQFAPYFSHREASMLEQLLIVPFSDGDRPQALLAVSEAPILRSHPEVLRIILAAVAQSAAETIRVQRSSRASVMQHSIVFQAEELPTVTGRLEERNPTEVRGLLLNLADVVSNVKTANEYVDSFRVFQDAARAVATLFASTGIAADAGGNRVLLLLHGESETDIDLLVHHVAATLWEYFPEIGGVSVPRYKMLRYPKESESLSGLAAALLRP